MSEAKKLKRQAKVWVVISPENQAQYSTTRTRRRGGILAWCQLEAWPRFESKGWRCVPAMMESPL